MLGATVISSCILLQSYHMTRCVRCYSNKFLYSTFTAALIEDLTKSNDVSATKQQTVMRLVYLMYCVVVVSSMQSVNIP